MGSEAREHRPLRLGRQMEEAVPGDDRIKCPAQRQIPHIANMKIMCREPLTAEADKGFGDVQPGDDKAPANQVRRNRFAGATAEVEYKGTGRQRRDKQVQPRTLEAVLPAHAIKGLRMTRIQSGDGIRV